MPNVPPYADRFDFGRLFADAGRVLWRAGPVILAGALVLGAVPVTLASVPWWIAPPGTPPETFQRIWMVVTVSKLGLILLAYTATSVFVGGLSLAVLTDATWRDVFRARRVAAAFITGLCLQIVVSWPNLVEPFSPDVARNVGLAWLLVIAGQLSFLAIMAWAGLAPIAALAEPRSIGRALARSVRLLRGLRWRMVGLAALYLFAQFVIEYAVALVLWSAGISYQTPGAGRAALSLTAVLVGVPSDAIFVSFYLQARRLTDGPTPTELHDVFG